MRDLRAVLQAGGRGERLRPFTDSTPKPLLAVAGVPMVERLTRQLADAGIRSVTVITGWLGDRIEPHLRSLAGLPSNLELSFFRESEPLGTLGALGALPADDRCTLFLFADLVTDLDFGQLLREHIEGGADVTLASHVEEHRLRLGEILSDGESVTGYLEKPEKQYLICSGIAIIEPPVIDLVSNDAPFGFPNLVSAAIRQGHQVRHWRHDAFWVDVNSTEALAEAEAHLLMTTPGDSLLGCERAAPDAHGVHTASIRWDGLATHAAHVNADEFARYLAGKPSTRAGSAPRS